MKPHLAHINNTLIKKHLAEKAKESPYDKYKKKVEIAKDLGISRDRIIAELKEEQERIKKDMKQGDELYLKGIRNAKKSCVDAIQVLIEELHYA